MLKSLQQSSDECWKSLKEVPVVPDLADSQLQRRWEEAERKHGRLFGRAWENVCSNQVIIATWWEPIKQSPGSSGLGRTGGWRKLVESIAG